MSRIVLAALLLLVGCASGGDRGPPQGGPGEDAGPPRELVFISPAGQPFRAPPGSAYPVDLWFRQADRNVDGALDPPEFVADAAAFFATLDGDRNGLLDGFEVSAYETKVAPEILPRVGRIRAGEGQPPLPVAGRGGRARGGPAQGGGRGGRPGPRALQGATPYALADDPQPIMSADFDQSRRVDAAEFTRKARELFAELDLARDGRLTLADLPQTPQQRRLLSAQAPGESGKTPPRRP